jgi:hypothetical protein
MKKIYTITFRYIKRAGARRLKEPGKYIFQWVVIAFTVEKVRREQRDLTHAGTAVNVIKETWGIASSS